MSRSIVCGSCYCMAALLACGGPDQDHPTRLIVEVVDASAAPIPTATVLVGYASGPLVSTQLQVSAQGSVIVSAGSEIAYIEVRANGYATYWRKLYGQETPHTLRAVLVPGGTLSVTVVSPSGEGVGGQWVLAALVPSDSPSREFWKRRFSLYTDDNGHASLGGFVPGTWDVHAPQWRSFEPSDHQFCRVVPHGVTHVTLVVEEVARTAFASGILALPNDAHVVDGIVSNYQIERQDGTGSDAAIYGKGDFYLFGTTGDDIVFKIRDLERTRVSRWVDVTIGEHGRRIAPVWEDDGSNL